MKTYRGIVEDNNSPLKDGRVRVRIIGLHSEDTTLVKTSDLPWAETVESLHFGFGSGIGVTSIPRTGTWVFLFLENDNPNKPIIFGACSGKFTEKAHFGGANLPMIKRLNEYDVNALATPGYPNNHVIETMAGHVIEIDDDSGTERIRICHLNGNEVLINNEGIHITSIKDRNETTAGKFTQTVLNTLTVNATGAIQINGQATINITSNGMTNIKSNEDINVIGAANINVKSTTDTNIIVGGNMNSTVTGNLTSVVSGNADITSSGTGHYKSSGPMQIEGSVVTLKSSSSTMVI
jgi:uncharacterized protein involved in type VI secretion and phage assembly